MTVRPGPGEAERGHRPTRGDQRSSRVGARDTDSDSADYTWSASGRAKTGGADGQTRLAPGSGDEPGAAGAVRRPQARRGAATGTPGGDADRAPLPPVGRAWGPRSDHPGKATKQVYPLGGGRRSAAATRSRRRSCSARSASRPNGSARRPRARCQLSGVPGPQRPWSFRSGSGTWTAGSVPATRRRPAAYRTWPPGPGRPAGDARSGQVQATEGGHKGESSGLGRRRARARAGPRQLRGGCPPVRLRSVRPAARFAIGAGGARGSLVCPGVPRGSVQGARSNARTLDGDHESLPEGYYLDRRDPDVLTLRRPDGSVVALFAADGASEAEIREAAENDTGS